MEAVSTDAPESPLAELLRTRVQQVLGSWEASGEAPASEAGRTALRRFLEALDELGEAAAALAAPKKNGATSAASRPNVLLATDDVAFAQKLRELLEPHGKVDVAPDAQHARRKALARTPAVLFASGAEAAETVRRVRELYPGLSTVVAVPETEVADVVVASDEEPVVVLPDSLGPTALALSIRALLFASRAARSQKRRGAGPAAGRSRAAGELPAAPQSYAHLAGLLPRALERTVNFDVGAAVIGRPGGEPIVDVHATRDCPSAMLQLVRDRALALYDVIAGRPSGGETSSPTPTDSLQSTIHVPLATEGRVVGLTYLAAFRPDAFSDDDRRVLAELAANASGAYRRLESAVRRLRLTPRQSQVLSLIASGLSDKEVGDRLGLAHRTVRTHIDRMLREHGLRSRTEAVAAWLRGQQE
ncbi:MAG TPA: LuxR C-terminal-related transcriptional regulator [Myxococcales bacterium]|nr:LuxR C-terminal-related transcriptional regulator [Myxococcales bacterium]